MAMSTLFEGNRWSLVWALGIVLASGSAWGFEQFPCREWNDVEIGLSFPPVVGGLSMAVRNVYGVDDYSVSYSMPETKETNDSPGRRRILTCYVYSRRNQSGDGSRGTAVQREFENSMAEIRAVCGGGATHVIGEPPVERRFPKSGLPYFCSELSGELGTEVQACKEFCLVAGFRGKFLKLRYTIPLTVKDGDAESRLKFVLADFDARLHETIEARKVDVYAIEDPKARLAALRRKWAGAETRVGMWDRPDYRELALRLHADVRWCDEKIAERAGNLESVSREGIELRIEPTVWYCTLARALSQQGKVEEGFAAWEKAVAAGCYDTDAIRKSNGFECLQSDTRYEKLLKAMEVVGPPFHDSPQEWGMVVDGVLRLSERNVQYSFLKNSFICDVKGLSAAKEAVALFVGDAEQVKDIEGLVAVVLPREAREKAYGPSVPNVGAIGEGLPLPVFFANAKIRRDAAREGAFTSAPERLSLNACSVRDTLGMEYDGSLGVLSCGDGYRAGVQDRLAGCAPVGLFCEGDDATPFVRAAVEAYRGLPMSVRTNALARGLLPDVLRSVLMDGRWRPCLTKRDLDLAAIRTRASKVRGVPPHRALFDRVEIVSPFTATTDLGTPPWNCPHVVDSMVYHVFNAYNAERRTVFNAKIREPSVAKAHRLVWKVLQGPEGGVLVIPDRDGLTARIEIDRPTRPFVVTLPNGETVTSLRVDIACFVEGDGQLSAPSVVSVAFSPNETREYDGEGRLVSIDYTRPQFGSWRSPHFVRGDWKDTFHYAPNGVMTGWTRVNAVEAITNDFSRDGFVVMSRDSIGRPKEVRRSLRAEWMQNLKEWVTTGEVFQAQMFQFGSSLEGQTASPLLNTLAWRYSYENDLDPVGYPAPMPPCRFSEMPDVAPRADFAHSGFATPLLWRMIRLYNGRYMAMKHGTEFDADVWLRSDSVVALEKEGLKPPKSLARMSFCKQNANKGGWIVSPEEFEELSRARLAVQSDGGCRLEQSEEGVPEDRRSWLSLRGTYRLLNHIGEMSAYKALDAAFERCTDEVVRKVFRNLLDEQMWKICRVLTGQQVPASNYGENAVPTFAAWRITDRIYFAVYNGCGNAFQGRDYIFVRTPWNEPSECVSMDTLDELPTSAIGNAFLGADQGDMAALNNLAVLNYAGIVNRNAYDEAKVKELLERSAMQGNVTAMRNLAILYENRGEQGKGKRYREAAKLREKDLPSHETR